MTREGPALHGARKAAILCMALGTDRASRILQQLSTEQVERISREIATLPAVNAGTVGTVLDEFQQVSRAIESVAQGGVEYARQLLEQTLGPLKGKSVLQRIQEQLVDTGLTRLRKAAPEALAGILRGEHPQTVALILAHLDVRQSSSVVEKMEPELASEALFRVARMDKISPEMLLLVETGLSSKTDIAMTEEMTASGGPGAVAKVLNLAGSTLEKQLLATIRERDGSIADAIQALMFVFEDILLVDGRGIQRVLREVEGKELALALKAASDELKAHIRANMSERAAQALDEEIEMMGPVRVRDVEAAHTRIIELVRGLADSGEIVIRGRGTGDDVIN